MVGTCTGPKGQLCMGQACCPMLGPHGSRLLGPLASTVRCAAAGMEGAGVEGKVGAPAAAAAPPSGAPLALGKGTLVGRGPAAGLVQPKAEPQARPGPRLAAGDGAALQQVPQVKADESLVPSPAAAVAAPPAAGGGSSAPAPSSERMAHRPAPPAPAAQPGAPPPSTARTAAMDAEVGTLPLTSAAVPPPAAAASASAAAMSPPPLAALAATPPSRSAPSDLDLYGDLGLDHEDSLGGSPVPAHQATPAGKPPAKPKLAAQRTHGQVVGSSRKGETGKEEPVREAQQGAAEVDDLQALLQDPKAVMVSVRTCMLQCLYATYYTCIFLLSCNAAHGHNGVYLHYAAVQALLQDPERLRRLLENHPQLAALLKAQLP